MPNELPLNELHRADGAIFEEREGWLLPSRYGDPAAEHRAVMTGVGLGDRSMVGKVTVSGRDRAAFLQGMLSNDIKAHQPGQGCPAAFLDAHGKVVSLLTAFVLEDRILLELPTGSTEKFLQAIDRFLISEKAYFEASDGAYVVLAVQGPAAERMLEGLSGARFDAAPYSHQEVTMAGAPVRPGIPSFGHDVDDSVILPETRLDHFVSYTKGCYIGQETVARVKYRGHINRGLSGLLLDGDRVPASGDPILAEGKEVGRVTSAVRSLALGRPIALGYVRREHFEPGSAVTVEMDGSPGSARVAELPFVKPA